ncbi:MAG: hypothetical protein PHC61_10035, partial [Chitinivibrionales bacterium]|nr:hypothetical protein [Chitinivibrionales bacterium]
MVKTAWQPAPEALGNVDKLIKFYQRQADRELQTLVREHCPLIMENNNNEYQKMLALTTKMALVGHACSEVAGFRFNARRQTISMLYGGCCFLADSFIDDYGERRAAEYIERFEIMLTKGWFDIRNDREKLFYVLLARIFALGNVLEPLARQAVFAVFLAQKRDVALRLNAPTFKMLPHRQQLQMLRTCSRDRSGHAITALTGLLVPVLSLRTHRHLFQAGALISCTDDHGDCYADRN